MDSFHVLEAMARARRPRAAESPEGRRRSAAGGEDSLYESLHDGRTWHQEKKTQEGCKASEGEAAPKADGRHLSGTTNIHI